VFDIKSAFNKPATDVIDQSVVSYLTSFVLNTARGDKASLDRYVKNLEYLSSYYSIVNFEVMVTNDLAKQTYKELCYGKIGYDLSFVGNKEIVDAILKSNL
jgi:hypothetical protein